MTHAGDSDNLCSVTLSVPEYFWPEYSGIGIWACARVLLERIFILCQRVLCEKVFTLSRITLGEGFRSKPVYSGNRSLPEPEYFVTRSLDLSQSTLVEGFYPEPEYSGRKILV